jgi:hypothetical protein
MVLAWVCLLAVLSAGAYGLRLTAAAMLPDREAADHINRVPSTRTVLIVAVDIVASVRKQAECDAAPNSFATDVLLVDASDFSAVVRTCSYPGVSGALPGSSLRE